MKNKIALVAAVKNEGPYLLEWIGYHLMIGVEHVYLYDDESADNSKAAYETMYKTGRLTVHKALKTGRRHRTQEDCYEEWRRRYGHLYEFVMPWDGDEFLCLRKGTTLEEFLSAIPEDVGQVRVNWKMFSSGNQLYANYDRFVMERFIMHANAGSPSNHITKLILRVEAMGKVNPETDESRPICAHCSSILPEYRTVGADLVTEVENHGATITPVIWNGYAVCNHYPIKSFEEFLTIKKPRSDFGNPKEIGSVITTDYFRCNDKSEMADERMLEYVDPLRAYVDKVKSIVLPFG